MRLLRIGLAAVAVAAAALPAMPVATAGEKPAQEWDGLERKYNENLDNVWVRPNVQFKAYKRVRLPPVQVSFAEDWDPNRGAKRESDRVSKEEIENIRAGMAQMFHKEFTRLLAKGGYVLSDANGDDVLIVQAALANIYIHGPKGRDVTNNIGTYYTMEAGRVSLVLQLSDSVTQQLLARVVDTQHGHEGGNLTWASPVASSDEVRRIIDLWAYELRKALDKVNK